MTEGIKQKFNELLQELVDIINLEDESHSVQNPLNPANKDSISFDDAGAFLNYNQENRTQPINWINNQTRLNEFNMNTLVSYIAQYANWATERGVRYYARTAIEPVIEDLIRHSAGWTEDSTLDIQTSGEIFNDYNNSTATGAYSAVFGENNHADGEHQFVLGKFNVSDKDAVYIIGWGESNESRKNIFVINKNGDLKLAGSLTLDGDLILTKGTVDVQKGDVNIDEGNLTVAKGDINVPKPPTKDQHAVNKLYVDTEVSRLKQLNQWIGSLDVTSAQYDLANKNAKLKPLLTQFVKTTSKAKRDPRNGDLVTVVITDKTATDPQYPEIWIFLETDPYNTSTHAGDWEFYSSQQSLLNASKNVKGLVQVGDNITVSDGIISIPLANGSMAGVVKAGENVTIEKGIISSYQYWGDF